MFGKRSNPNALPLPSVAADERAVEVLRVWAAPGQPQQFVLKPTWKDPAAWGLLLVDIARQAADAYSQEGLDREEAIARIRAGLDAKWSKPAS